MILPLPCRIWEGSKNHHGYGRIRRNGRIYRVHRWFWEKEYGPIPPGKVLCHHCDHPACYEMTHLFLGTPRDNMVDAKQKGRIAVGNDNGRAKLTPEIVAEIRATVRPNPVGIQGGSGYGPAARRYGVNVSTIKQVLTGATWGPVVCWACHEPIGPSQYGWGHVLLRPHHHPASPTKPIRRHRTKKEPV